MIKPGSPALQADSLPSEPPGEPYALTDDDTKPKRAQPELQMFGWLSQMRALDDFSSSFLFDIITFKNNLSLFQPIFFFHSAAILVYLKYQS